MDWLAEGVDRGPSLIFSYLYPGYLDFDDGLGLCQRSDAGQVLHIVISRLSIWA